MKITPINTSPQHLDAILRYLDITNSETAELCQTNVRTVYRWLSGRSPVPASVMRMAELIAMTKTFDRHGRAMLSWEPKKGWKRP
jgi:pyocin large subunit-like protein